MQNKINIQNKRARFDFEILEKFTAGIQLCGTEIKAIRLGKASIVEGYCHFHDGELWIKNMSISEYDFGSFNTHKVHRERKLLLTKKELRKLERKTKETGNTIVPLRLFISDKGWAKMDIALAKGKKYHDKRQSLKTSDHKREMDRARKNF